MLGTVLAIVGSVALGAPFQSVPTYTAEQFYDTVSIGGASFSHDGSRLLIHTDETGVFNVYAQPVDGGERVALTESDDDARFAVSYFPDDDRVLFTADEGGNELNHLYVREPDGATTDLTPGENLKAQFVRWSGDGSRFWVQTNERNPQFFDLYEYETEGYGRELIYQNDTGMTVSDVSRDGRWLALSKVNNNADSDIYVIDLASEDPEPRLITPRQTSDDFIMHRVASFTPDGTTLLFLSNAGGEFDRLRSYVLGGLPEGERNHRVVEEANWDIMYSGFSRDGRYRVTGVNADAKTEVRVYEVESGERVGLPEVPRGDVTGVSFSPDSSVMAFYVNGDTSPSNLYVMEMATGQTRRLTDSMNPEIDAEHLVESEVVRYESFDGLEIPAVLYRPQGSGAESPAPALVWVHGGPGGQSRTGYNPMIQYFVNHGYAVLAVNNRGSSGYGKTFFHLDDRDHGGGDLDDCVWGKRYLADQPWVDADRIGIIGGSYGGYMVAAALAFRPEEFDVGVNIFGVTNWVRTLESIPPWWESFRDSLYAELGDPATDGERLHAISPLFHAENILKPMMVIQGANDPRVLQVESDEIVEAARANGVPVEYIVFPDEGHGFRKKSNRITAAEGIRNFLDGYLKGK